MMNDDEQGRAKTEGPSVDTPPNSQASDCCQEVVETPPHPTRTVSWGDVEAEIDVEIADLILDCWKAGLVTMNSCQDNSGGRVWIQFLTCGYAERFLDQVAVYDESYTSLYNRIRHAWDPPEGLRPEVLWEYRVFPFDYGVHQEIIDDCYIDETFLGQHDFEFSCSVRFPRTDLPVVCERLAHAASLAPALGSSSPSSPNKPGNERGEQPSGHESQLDQAPEDQNGGTK